MGNICRQNPINDKNDLEVTSSQPPPIQQMPPSKPEEVKTQAVEKQEEPAQSIDQAKQENEPKRKEQKKMAKIAAVIDQEVIYENVQKQEKVKSPFDYQLLLNAFGNSFIFGQLQPEDKQE
ncbi:unnamed protein product [Paramecium primaurelia]|uniref:Uncharacterized protein n=1 Tax=Paramecium primaurelia TaxID=5886 RepID=A0A8S1JZF8_PARPR|nr:unnamed protein product [Paramecium primaurelia]